MGKRSKGFGNLLQQERRKAKNSAKSEPKITILGKEEDNEPYFESNLEEQEQRIGVIVGLDQDGEILGVNAQTRISHKLCDRSH